MPDALFAPIRQRRSIRSAASPPAGAGKKEQTGKDWRRLPESSERAARLRLADRRGVLQAALGPERVLAARDLHSEPMPTLRSKLSP